ncbi:MAG: hypothetical protein ONB31_15210 [candidate division KSB1 bacterium]|nr:hypothetical protein [candidate division KSB1 bacterium]MDZ7335448.1 hypothetical protein [candidate division KSB1 bacterium]MDZ7358779.1 hypothetical protein [candidate division KSB1 bacterium]MDZ7400286.1 hypothetical protein [candidate division KSB1 bacterium]
MIARSAPDQVVETIGIYCDSSVFLDEFPVVRIFENGRSYIPLSTKLSCPDGMLIKIRGKVIRQSVRYPVAHDSLQYNYLSPLTFEILYNTRQIIKTVSDEYCRMREKLQEAIAVEGSRLQLLPNPSWAIWFDTHKNQLIFHSHQYDLMYAADIEFIFDLRSRKILDVYARQRFKGEL